MNKNRKPHVAIIGATGIVGRELVKTLQERSFKLESLELFASKNSTGEIIEFKGEELIVQELLHPDQITADIAFFSAGPKISLAYIDKASRNGTICIDKSGAYRLQKEVPLIVPEVNKHLIKESSKIIASPNCVVTPLVQVLHPIQERYELSQVIVSTYQAVSGAGKQAADELESQVRNLFNLRAVNSIVFDKRIAFNILPFVPAHGKTTSLGKTDEEQKIIEETKKILELYQLKMEVTCVRVPIFNGHSLSVNITTRLPIKIDEAQAMLAQAPGIILIDSPEKGSYPTPLDASGEDMTFVGRLRPNTAAKNGLSLWISSDNLRTGAALNAVRIAETICGSTF